MSLKIGYIGLGIMGRPMARNILKAGFDVVVHNRSRASVDELVAEGAKEAFSAAEVARQVDIIFTNCQIRRMWSWLHWVRMGSLKAHMTA